MAVGYGWGDHHPSGAAADSGKVLGTAEQPKPVVQSAEYRLDNRAGGNINSSSG